MQNYAIIHSYITSSRKKPHAIKAKNGMTYHMNYSDLFKNRNKDNNMQLNKNNLEADEYTSKLLNLGKNWVEGV